MSAPVAGPAPGAGKPPRTLGGLALMALPVLLADVVAKRLAVAHLQPLQPRAVVGNAVRLTLSYNTQGVMGLSAGPYGRWLWVAVAVAALVILARLFRATPPGERLRAVAIAAIVGGALGNLADRLASAGGVVDFIDVGTAGWRFWTFNVADMAIDVGAVLLAWTLWRSAKRDPAPS